jgi:hypothetical protein
MAGLLSLARGKASHRTADLPGPLVVSEVTYIFLPKLSWTADLPGPPEAMVALVTFWRS